MEEKTSSGCGSDVVSNEAQALTAGELVQNFVCDDEVSSGTEEIAMIESEFDDGYETPPEILEEAGLAKGKVVPTKSSKCYMLRYQKFMKWREENKLRNFSENVFLAYLHDLSKTMKSSSIWSIFSMIKSVVLAKHQVDIKKYSTLIAFLKQNGKGFVSKISKDLSAEEVDSFLEDAPNLKYLATKVATIFGVYGACRTIELTTMTVTQVKKQGAVFVISISNTKTHVPRSFVIEEAHAAVVEEYQLLRPSHAVADRFFLNYREGKCTIQPIGKNKFSKMPSEIATFLNLPHPETYTGHCFRRTSATLLSSSGANMMELQRHGGWLSATVAKGYVADSIGRKKPSNKIFSEIKGKPHVPVQNATVTCPSHKDDSSSRTETSAHTEWSGGNMIQTQENTTSKDVKSVLENNSCSTTTQLVSVPPNHVENYVRNDLSSVQKTLLEKNFHFSNCSVTINFNN